MIGSAVMSFHDQPAASAGESVTRRSLHAEPLRAFGAEDWMLRPGD